MADHDALNDRRQALEDAFFAKQEKKKIEAMRNEIAKATRRDELRAASGMKDDAVLEKLAELGVGGDTAIALSIVPLIHVAFADGTLEEAEEKAIVKAARDKGIQEGTPAHKMLASWLAAPDVAGLFDAWSNYIRALGAQMPKDEYRQLETQILEMARGVAEAAGGILGMGKISGAEKTALSQIQAAFSSK